VRLSSIFSRLYLGLVAFLGLVQPDWLSADNLPAQFHLALLNLADDLFAKAEIPHLVALMQASGLGLKLVCL
tara:strand:- start:63 stop:278 length:216 start_codon:yes stop_codon:yes gene_type:complete